MKFLTDGNLKERRRIVRDFRVMHNSEEMSRRIRKLDFMVFSSRRDAILRV